MTSQPALLHTWARRKRAGAGDRRHTAVGLTQRGLPGPRLPYNCTKGAVRGMRQHIFAFEIKIHVGEDGLGAGRWGPL